jgi:L-aspartate oxidase
MNQHFSHDNLIIGSGAAGLALALNLSEHSTIAILSKNRLKDGSTWWAQGGIAAVLDDKDSIEAHVKDTVKAGGGLCHLDAVTFTVENSADAIAWLIKQGVNFTRNTDNDDFHLTKEGGHSHRRIIHSTDATGKEVHRTLIERLRAAKNVDVFEQHIAVDLIQQAEA